MYRLHTSVPNREDLRWTTIRFADASYQCELRHGGVTEIVEIPNRGHALTIDSGWREVAHTALAFIRRFV
jgi:hypothetical protein